MRSLAERHEDRAKRIAANRADTNVGVPGGITYSVATVEGMMRDALAARARLGDDERRELDKSLDDARDEISGARSLAEAPDGSGDTMAGIGVVNTRVVPAAVLATAEEGNGGGASADAGWGATVPVTEAPLPKADAPAGNAAGAALVDQGVIDPKAKSAVKSGGDKAK